MFNVHSLDFTIFKHFFSSVHTGFVVYFYYRLFTNERLPHSISNCFGAWYLVYLKYYFSFPSLSETGPFSFVRFHFQWLNLIFAFLCLTIVGTVHMSTKYYKLNISSSVVCNSSRFLFIFNKLINFTNFRKYYPVNDVFASHHFPFPLMKSTQWFNTSVSLLSFLLNLL